MYDKLMERIRSEKVLLIVIAAAIISCLFTGSENITDYINTDTVGITFSVLAVGVGLNENGLFDKMGYSLAKRCKSTRKLSLILVTLTFISAAFVSDMAAVVIFAKITQNVIGENKKVFAYVLSLLTAASNIGCMLNPCANVANLFIYNNYNMDIKSYFLSVFPLYIVETVILFALALCTTNEEIIVTEKIPEKTDVCVSYVAIYIALMVLNILSIPGTVDMLTVFASACLVLVIMDPQILKKIDYSPIVLIIALYILRGNLSVIRELYSFLSHNSSKLALSNVIFSQLTGNTVSSFIMSIGMKNAGLLLRSTSYAGLLLPFSSYTKKYMLRFAGKELENPKIYYIYDIVIGIIFMIFVPGIYNLILSPVLPEVFTD